MLRLESPVQGLLRETVDDVELHGVTIPAGSVLNLRYAAGNRDERQFECPEEIDLDRKGLRRLPLRRRLAPRLGAPLARREMYYGFKALVDRVERLWFVEGANDFSHHQNFSCAPWSRCTSGSSRSRAGRSPAPTVPPTRGT